MGNADRATRWPYPLGRVTAVKEGTRLSVPPGQAWDLVGVDGQLVGGLRPFPGFRRIHEFTAYANQAPHNNPTVRSVITDFKVVSFIVGSEHYGLAIVYRVKRASSENADIFVDWWYSRTKTWTFAQILWQHDDLAPEDAVKLPPSWMTNPSEGQEMSVVSVGRLVYVYVKNHRPILFYVVDDGTIVTGNVVLDTGPGRRPFLKSADEFEGLGDVRTTGHVDRDGNGQVVLLEYYPSEVGLGLTQPDESIRSLINGGYSFAYRLRDTRTGRVSAISEFAQARSADFDPLAYGGSSSGAGTGFTSGDGISVGSGVQSLFAAIEICYNPDKYDQAMIYRSVRVEGAGGTFTSKILFLEKVIDLKDYHTVNNPLPDESGEPRRQSVYFYSLEDKQLVQKSVYQDLEVFDEEPPRGGAAEWYKGTMIVSNLRLSLPPSSDEDVLLDLYGQGVGEIRWTSVFDVTPELFPVYNRWLPSTPSDDVLTFHASGPHVVGFSRSRQYILRKEPGDLRVEPAHEGYGVVGEWASDTVGSLVYFVTEKGVKTVDAFAQMEDVRYTNQIIVERWPRGSLLGVSAAYDPVGGALYLLNPTAEEAVVFWFNTAMVTTLEDMTFSQVRRGPWPHPFTYDEVALLGGSAGLDNPDYNNPLRETALFLLNHRDENGTTTGEAYPALYVADYNRVRTEAAGYHGADYAQTTLMELTGDAVFTVSAWNASFGLLGLSTTGGKTVPEDVSNRHVYVLKSATPSLVGTRAVIHGLSGSNTLRIPADERDNLSGLAVGDVVGISPVYFEWGGHPLGILSDDGTPYAGQEDFLWVRHATALGCFFTDVTGSALEETDAVARYQAVLYEGTSDVPKNVSEPKDTSGNPVNSVANLEGREWAAFGASPSDTLLAGSYGVDGTSLSPAVRIFCPNLDYRLVGVALEGRVRPTSRTAFARSS